MSYTVLARRYRSETFDEVVGQDPISQTLKNAIATERVAHAYLFTGTRGVGKTTMARILAKAINCLAAEKPTATPCCKCESCEAISTGEDIDVIEIDAASNTGVEHIRELRQNAIYRPARARFKIYIIDEVHMLSVSAFNALLKTLEEPPEHVMFILATTEPNKVLATIQSRCQRFDFRNIQASDIAGQLVTVLAGEGVEAEEALVRRVARLAHGSMRDALSLLDQLLSMSEGKLTAALMTELIGGPRSEQIIELGEAVAQGDCAEALRRVDEALGQGLALEQLAEALQRHFRDLMVLRNCGDDTELVDADEGPERTKAIEQAKLFDDAALVYSITVLEELRRAIKGSGSGRALLEAAVVRLTATERFSDTRALLEQLQKMPRGTGSAASANAIAPARRGTAPATKVEAPKAAAAQVQASPAAVLDVPGALTLEYFTQEWANVLAALGRSEHKHLVRYLASATPAAWENSTLALRYPAEAGMMKLLADQSSRLDELGKALSALLGHPVKLRLDQEAEAAKPGVAPDGGNGASGRSAPGAKPSQKDIDAALADPQVKSVQQTLGGRVRHVGRE